MIEGNDEAVTEIEVGDEGGDGTESSVKFGEPADRGDFIEGAGGPAPDDDGEPDSEPDADAGAGEPDDEGQAEPSATAKPDGPPPTIPYARFAELNAQNKELMELVKSLTGNIAGAGKPSEAAETKPAAPETPAFDFKAKVAERTSALMEGDEERAVAIDLEIEQYRNQVLVQQVRQQATQDALQQIQKVQQQTQVETIISRAFQANPELDDKSDSFDEAKLDDVLMRRDYYMNSKNMGFVEALTTAIDHVFPGKAAPATKQPDLTAEQIARRRQIMGQQPPVTSHAGTSNRETIDISKLDVEKMSESEYEKLPADVKRKLRGDAVRA